MSSAPPDIFANVDRIPAPALKGHDSGSGRRIVWIDEGDGVHVASDTLGHPETCFNSILGLRWWGKHVQVGRVPGDRGAPIGRKISLEESIDAPMAADKFRGTGDGRHYILNGVAAAIPYRQGFAPLSTGFASLAG